MEKVERPVRDIYAGSFLLSRGFQLSRTERNDSGFLTYYFSGDRERLEANVNRFFQGEKVSIEPLKLFESYRRLRALKYGG